MTCASVSRARLEQHRVHVGVRHRAGRPAPAAPARGRSRRRRAVTALLSAMFCGLNGATLTPSPREPAAQARDERALAGIGRRALDHQGAAHRMRARTASSLSHSSRAPSTTRSDWRCSVSGLTTTACRASSRAANAAAPAVEVVGAGRIDAAGDDGVGVGPHHRFLADGGRQRRQRGEHVARAAQRERLADQVLPLTVSSGRCQI